MQRYKKTLLEEAGRDPGCPKALFDGVSPLFLRAPHGGFKQ